MKNDTVLTMNWFRINLPTIIAVGTLFWYIWSQDAEQDKKLDLIEANRIQINKETESNFNEINSDLSALSAKTESVTTLVYRVSTIEAKTEEVSTRLNRISESLLSAIESLRKEMNTLTTEVKILSNELKRDEQRKQSKALTIPPKEFYR